ncbi:MAG: hypothetical protein KAI66_01330 [Lentisphaeria bacterium]|nr:hypothetical protein [Lentisphaeria bacterium]
MKSKKSSLQIGWASRDVTPYGRKVDLSGQFHMRITDVVNDPLTVTALAISSGDAADNSVVFVSCDTAVIPAYLIEECEAKIREKSDSFPVDALVFNATHTHAAPNIRDGLHDYGALPLELSESFMAPPEYRDFLAGKIAEVVLESWDGRRKGMLAWGLGHAVVGHNRRASYLGDFDQQEFPGQKIEHNARMYGKTDDPAFSHAEGFEDHSVQFLYTFNMDKKLTGAIVNVPCPSQVTESWSRASADYWHDTRECIRATHGQDIFILPQCSAAGDQSPHLQLHKAAEARMLALKEGVEKDELDFNLAQRREIGRRIKTAFDEVLQWAAKDLRSEVDLKHLTKTIPLSRRTVTDEECRKNLQWSEELKQASGPNVLSFMRRCEDVVKKHEEQKSIPSFPIEIHVVRLGDIAFATNPFELFLDYGVRVQARGPAIQTFVVQLAGSRGGADSGVTDPGRFPRRGGSYLPTARAEAGGGYSACVYCNQVGHKGGQEWVEETLRELDALFA